MMECAGCLAFFASILMMHGDAMKNYVGKKGIGRFHLIVEPDVESWSWSRILKFEMSHFVLQSTG